MTSFYSPKELKKLGLNRYGENILISRFTRIYNPQNITLGNNVRIDDYCILSAGGKIIMEDFTHIGCFGSLMGKGDIIIKNYGSISGRVSIYSSSDDYSGNVLSNPLVDIKNRNVKDSPVILEKYTLIGCGAVILPGVTIKEGSAVGAMSLVKEDVEEWSLYAGIPARFIKKRSKNLLNLI